MRNVSKTSHVRTKPRKLVSIPAPVGIMPYIEAAGLNIKFKWFNPKKQNTDLSKIKSCGASWAEFVLGSDGCIYNINGQDDIICSRIFE